MNDVRIDPTIGAPFGAACYADGTGRSNIKGDSRVLSSIDKCKIVLNKFPNIDINKAHCSVKPLESVSAFNNNNVELLEYLLSLEKIDVNSLGDGDELAITTAMNLESLEIFNRFLKHPKLNIRHLNKNQENLLDLACKYSDTVAVKTYLVTKLWETGKFSKKELQLAELEMLKDKVLPSKKKVEPYLNAWRKNTIKKEVLPKVEKIFETLHQSITVIKHLY